MTLWLYQFNFILFGQMTFDLVGQFKNSQVITTLHGDHLIIPAYD